MEELLKELQKLKEQFSTLRKKHFEREQRERDLKNENMLLKKQVEKLEDQLIQLGQENASLKSANALMGSSSYNKETKQQINRLIQQIDYCLIALSKE